MGGRVGGGGAGHWKGESRREGGREGSIRKKLLERVGYNFLVFENDLNV